MAWLLLKDTVESCMEYRVTGLAAEAAFFVLLSLPPLLLGLVGALGYVDTVIGLDTIDHIRHSILSASSTVLSDKGVNDLVKPLVDDVFHGRRPDLVSLGFLIALWSGSRAVNVFVDTITIMYGLEGRRGIVKTRLMSLVLYVVALVLGAAVLPLLVAGPDAVTAWLPGGAGVVHVLYWPAVLLASVAFLTTLYHVSVPVRSAWYEDVPGALVALLMWAVGSFVLRIYLTHSVEGPTIYGSLAAPVAVLLWIGVSAFAVLVGAAVNAAVDRVWPSLATAAAREENARLREAAAAEVVARAAADLAAVESGEDEEYYGADDAPSEYPERWAGFLPPSDLRARLRPRRTAPVEYPGLGQLPDQGQGQDQRQGQGQGQGQGQDQGQDQGQGAPSVPGPARPSPVPVPGRPGQGLGHVPPQGEPFPPQQPGGGAGQPSGPVQYPAPGYYGSPAAPPGPPDGGTAGPPRVLPPRPPEPPYPPVAAPWPGDEQDR
ncbi:membrane protein [Streptomyces sp. DvalAA-14]|nr:membrane protein [Streptomyces sp. DvalAA-14]